jgi:precorrin-6B methylase 2
MSIENPYVFRSDRTIEGIELVISTMITPKSEEAGIVPFENKYSIPDLDEVDPGILSNYNTAHTPISDTYETKGGQQKNRPTVIDTTKHPLFAELPPYAQAAADRAEMVLNLCGIKNLIDLSTSRRIVDFGAGSGEPTITLSQLANMNGGTVDVLERSSVGADALRQSGIVDPGHVHEGDGIAYLADARVAGEYDLITAFMFGPDPAGVLAADLLDASRNALAYNGHLLISSEISSISALCAVCEQRGIRYDFIDALPVDGNTLPYAVVIGAADIRGA